MKPSSPAAPGALELRRPPRPRRWRRLRRALRRAWFAWRELEPGNATVLCGVTSKGKRLLRMRRSCDKRELLAMLDEKVRTAENARDAVALVRAEAETIVDGMRRAGVASPPPISPPQPLVEVKK